MLTFAHKRESLTLMRLKQNVIYQKVCESLEKDRVYLRPSLSLSELSVIVGTTIARISPTR